MSQMSEKTCRICLKGLVKVNDPLLRSCKCKADIVHKSCIEKWLELTAQTNCPLCGFKYITNVCPKNYLQYIKETPEDWDQMKELCLRAVNVIHLTFLGSVIWLHNSLNSVQNILYSIIFVVTVVRCYVVYRLCSLFYSRSKYSFHEWQSTHFTVKITGIPEPNH